ncbi:flavodoxin family protein [bacterium]|nr:flavodoxin family protein [bacterium]
MRVIAICGSPRKDGNSTILAQEVLKGAAEAGATTDIFLANDLKMRGCQGCEACNENGHCIQKDDMTALYGEIEKADAVVFASPVYMFGMTGQLKLVLDRLYAYLGADFKSSLPKGKKVGLVFTQGMPDVKGFAPYFDSVGHVLKMLGFEKPESILVGAGLGAAGGAAEKKELLDSARALGKRLVS